MHWFNDTREAPTFDPLLRAAITHFWFVTLHPFDDGNDRITRLLTDLALAQAEHQSTHFYAMPVAILAHRKSYYEVLEMYQKGDLDITSWLMWLLNTLNEAFDDALEVIDRTVFKTNFWARVDQTQLHSEQVEVLNRMLDGDLDQGINTSHIMRWRK